MKKSTAIKSGLASATAAVLLTLGGPVANVLADSATEATPVAPTSGDQPHEVVDCGLLMDDLDGNIELSNAEVVELADLTDEDIASINADGQALMDAFDAAGITYTTHTEDGITFPEWDYDNDEANTIADQVFTDLYGDEIDACIAAESEGNSPVVEIEAEMTVLPVGVDIDTSVVGIGG